MIENLTESLVARVSLLESLASKIRKDTSRSVASLRKRQGGIASREGRPGSGQDDMKNVQQKQPVNIEAAKALSSIRRYIDSLETQHKALKKEIAAEGQLIREARTQAQWVVDVLGVGFVAIGFPFVRSLFGRAKESKDKQV